MASIDSLSNITDQRKVRLKASLRQGQKHDFFGTAQVLHTQEPPLIRIKLTGKSGQDRPSARAMDPEGDFSIRLGIGNRAATVSMRLNKVESDDQALFEPVEVAQKEQNRAFFRVQTNLETKIIPKQGAKPKDTFYVGLGKDISGGGMRMVTSERFKPGTTLDVEFGLEVNEKQVIILCSATVVRSVHLGEGKYEVAVEFRDLLEEQQEVVIAYCFAKQREQLRDKVQTRDV